MSNQTLHLLSQWAPLKDKHQWVMGLIYKTEGSCYRKAGALMLFSDDGHQLGILSGGCLESDIHRKARRVMQDKKVRHTIYDDNDEEDIAFKLGVGCGGVVHLALLPVEAENCYLSLEKAYQTLLNGQHCRWKLNLEDISNSQVSSPSEVQQLNKLAKLDDHVNYAPPYIDIPFTCPPHLLVVGGGFDATFVVKMAHLQGWTVSVWDPRPAQARVEHFSLANYIVSSSEVSAVSEHMSVHNVDAAVLMSHHRNIDAEALKALSAHHLQYIAMLGPKHRKEEILSLAQVEESALSGVFLSPAGFDIGGELPESIALSVIAQCHSVLAGKESSGKR